MPGMFASAGLFRGEERKLLILDESDKEMPLADQLQAAFLYLLGILSL